MLSEVSALWRRCWCVHHKERGLLQSLNHLCLLQSPRTQRKGVAPRIVVKGDLAGYVVHNNTHWYGPKQAGALSDINKWRLEKLRGATTAAERFPRPARGRRNEKPR